MNIQILVLSLFVFTCGCSNPGGTEPITSNVTETALNTHDTRGFYYLEYDKVVRLLCPSGSILIDRVNCDKGVQKLYFWGVENYVRSRYGENVDKFDQQLSQIRTRIIQLDTQILTLLNTDPDHVPDLLPDMTRIQDQIIDLDADINGLSDQVARIKAERQQQDTPDLRALQTRHEHQIAGKRVVRDELQKNLEALRNRYYDANSSILSQATFQRLLNQRSSYVSRHDETQRSLSAAMDSLVAYHQSIKFLEDSGTWEFTDWDGNDQVSGAARTMGAAFRDLHANTSQGLNTIWEEGAKRFRVEVPVVGAMLQSIGLDVGPLNQNCTDFRIYGDRFSVELGASKVHSNFQNYNQVLSQIFEQTVDGRWYIEPKCVGGINPQRMMIELYRRSAG